MVASLFARAGATSVVISALVALFCFPGALASAATTNTTTSSNWAGYAVHGAGVTFRTVAGSWRQPSATCIRGANTYSSYWVGIGGYSESSHALEQIGTEIDCLAGGQVRSTAWYELVPANAVVLHMAVRPGDLMNAGVTVNGTRVSVSLYDATRKQGFSKTLTASQIDVTSAEWMVEAPSDCSGQYACQPLPLTNFGTAAFSGAAATSNTGHSGGISDPAWQTTEVKLVSNVERLFVSSGAPTLLGNATRRRSAPTAARSRSITRTSWARPRRRRGQARRPAQRT